MVKGRMDGVSTLWHENGQKKATSVFKDGKEEGLISWNETGNEAQEK